MSLELVNATVVLVAKLFNPSIFRDHWLIEHGVLRKEEFRDGCVFTDLLVQIRSEQFDAFVVPEQFQFSPHVPPEQEHDLIVHKIDTIISTLPHTPYSAVGLNFHWHLSPERTSIEVLSRRLFFVGGSPLHRAFDSDDARFGGYLSKKALGFRLKTDVKPILRSDGQEQAMQLAFNFHSDLTGSPEDRVASIRHALSTWVDARHLAAQIAEISAEGDTP